jgi:hypothetical protein
MNPKLPPFTGRSVGGQPLSAPNRPQLHYCFYREARPPSSTECHRLQRPQADGNGPCRSVRVMQLSAFPPIGRGRPRNPKQRSGFVHGHHLNLCPTSWAPHLNRVGSADSCQGLVPAHRQLDPPLDPPSDCHAVSCNIGPPMSALGLSPARCVRGPNIVQAYPNPSIAARGAGETSTRAVKTAFGRCSGCAGQEFWVVAGSREPRPAL